MNRSLETFVLALFLAGCAPRPVRLLTPAGLDRQAPEEYRARFETSQGVFVVKVTRALAPKGADRFYNLVAAGFYDGTRFYRVRPEFVVQWGVHPDPAVSKAWGREVGIGDDPVRRSNTKGTITFASAGPDTRGTQVYVNMADNARLDKMGFAPFGEVAEGFEVFGKLHSSYGEIAPRGKGPDQKKLRSEGEAYLAREFPKLDRVVRARILR